MSELSKQVFHIPVSADGITAVDCLANASGFSKHKIKQCMQKGCVWLERVAKNSVQINLDSEFEQGESLKQGYIQRLRRAKKILHKNEILHFYYDETVLNNEIADAVLIEDFGDYSIWNKPSGMLSQGSKWGDHCTIYRWAEKHLQPERPAFIVHRLDRAANGLIILAHKKKVASQFSKLFEQRDIEKQYQVKVVGNFKEKIDLEERLMITDDIDQKSAISHVSILSFDESENTSTLNVKIETGRKHQIRKHLAGIGFPVLGDRLYGSHRNTNKNINLQLQAKSLAFLCPVTNLPKNFTLDS